MSKSRSKTKVRSTRRPPDRTPPAGRKTGRIAGRKRPKLGRKEERARKPKQPPRKIWRVLVTGFHDWPNSETEALTFNVWRCIENPSGLLLLGKPYEGVVAPTKFDGPLAKLLRKVTKIGQFDIEWTFATMPVTWNAIKKVPIRKYDTVMSLGVGVYPPDPSTRILIERGAINERSAMFDAAGRVAGRPKGPPTTIEAGAGRTSTPNKGSGVVPRIDAAVKKKTVKGGGTDYEVTSKKARRSNSYLCNETYYHLLSAMNSKRAKPKRAYFIHVAKAGRLTRLAQALRNLIVPLVEP